MNLFLHIIAAVAQHDAHGQGHHGSKKNKKQEYIAPIIETTEPIMSCPKPFAMVGKECIKSSKHDAVPKCAVGHLNKDGMCESRLTENALQGCPSGFELSKGNQCVAVEMVAQDMFCKEGEYQDGMCISDKTTVPKLYCPKGTKLEQGLCISTTKTRAKEVCEDGFTLSRPGKCSRTEYTEPVIVCPQGFSPLGDQCVKYSQPDVSCPRGFQLIPPGNCVKTIKSRVTLTCPEGYKQKGDKCILGFEYAPDMVCKDGYMYNAELDTCYTIIEESPKPKCEAGDRFVDGICETHVSEPAMMVCQSGEMDGHGYCVEEVVEESIIGCPRGKELESDGTCSTFAQMNMLCDFGYLNENKEYCAAEISVDSELECNSGEQNGQFCYEESGAEPVALCPEGSVQFGDVCEYPSTMPSSRCPRGYKSAIGGGCSKTVTVDSSPFCRPELDLVGNSCVKFSEEYPDYVCRSGVYSQGECVDHAVAHPLATCPDSYKYDAAHGLCERAVHVEKVYPESPPVYKEKKEKKEKKQKSEKMTHESHMKVNVFNIDTDNLVPQPYSYDSKKKH